LLFAALLLVGCGGEEANREPGVTATVPGLATVVETAGAVEAGSPGGENPGNPGGTAETVAPEASALPATATPTPGPTATPHPLERYTLDALRARTYPGGAIELLEVQEQSAVASTILFSYPSDGLTITGQMRTPPGPGPFPVVVMLHGYVDRDRYAPGSDTRLDADYFVRRGYLTLAPDYRTWGGSDEGESLFHTGLVIDTLNLLSSLPSLPQADPERLVLWGHSMGGGVATKVLTIDPRPKAAVLYAPNSPDDADLIARWGPGCRPGVPRTVDNGCNPGESLPAWLPAETVEAYYAGAADPEFQKQVAPLYHLEQVQVPVQIHIGDRDGAFLEETPPEWAQKLYTGLLAADVPVAFFNYPGAGHTFNGDDWNMMMERVAAFYDEVLGE
jgi:uncharacterized protein